MERHEKEENMKRVFAAVLLLSLLVSPLALGDCQNFTCFYDDQGSATTCDVTYCGGGGSCGNYYALTCSVYCDKMGGYGMCWCNSQGECMIV
jgi:hypothetical protein